jgi:hypothetical protein
MWVASLTVHFRFSNNCAYDDHLLATLRFKDLVHYLVCDMGANVDHQLKNLVGTKVEGSVLALAMEDPDLDLVELLCKELGANVNEPVTLAGKPTTIVHLALQNLSL